MDFQNDGEYVGGCIAGGRRYLHINANGDGVALVKARNWQSGCRRHRVIRSRLRTRGSPPV